MRENFLRRENSYGIRPEKKRSLTQCHGKMSHYPVKNDIAGHSVLEYRKPRICRGGPSSREFGIAPKLLKSN